MMAQFFLQHHAHRQKRSGGTYLIMEPSPTRQRGDGGLYTSNKRMAIVKVDAVNVTHLGHTRHAMVDDGIRPIGTEIFHVPYKDLEKYNIKNPAQPGTKLFYNNFMFAVTNIQPMDELRVYEFETDRQRGPRGTKEVFAMEWDFSIYTLLEDEAVLNLNTLVLDGGKATLHFRDILVGPAASIIFKANFQDDCSFTFADETFTFTLEGGQVTLTATGETFAINEWHDFEIIHDPFKETFSFAAWSKSIDTFSEAIHEPSFLGQVMIKDLEVSCVAE